MTRRNTPFKTKLEMMLLLTAALFSVFSGILLSSPAVLFGGAVPGAVSSAPTLAGVVVAVILALASTYVVLWLYFTLLWPFIGSKAGYWVYALDPEEASDPALSNAISRARVLGFTPSPESDGAAPSATATDGGDCRDELRPILGYFKVNDTPEEIEITGGQSWDYNATCNTLSDESRGRWFARKVWATQSAFTEQLAVEYNFKGKGDATPTYDGFITVEKADSHERVCGSEAWTGRFQGTESQFHLFGQMYLERLSRDIDSKWLRRVQRNPRLTRDDAYGKLNDKASELVSKAKAL